MAEKKQKINMGMARYGPNIITLTRPALTFIFIYFILQDKYMSAILLFAVICLTDLFDGITARALGACTHLGAYMDVFADLLYIMSSLILLNIKGLAPAWFTVVTAFKFVEFAVTSSILKKSGESEKVWIFDTLGRYFAALAFLSPGIFCLAVLLLQASKPIILILLISSCALAITSSAARIARCINRSNKVINKIPAEKD